MARKKHNRRQGKAKKAIIKAAAKEPGPRERREVITLNPAPELDLRPETKWFVVFTGPRAEAKAMAGLEEAGCAVFWPSSHKVVTVGKRTTFDGDVATFARYLFVSGPLMSFSADAAPANSRQFVVKGKPIGGIFDIDGILDVVSDRNGWVRVPNFALRAIADYQNGVRQPALEEAVPAFKPGDDVTIIEGPFMSLQASIVDSIGLDQAKVLIEAFGRRTVTTISIAALRAA